MCIKTPRKLAVYLSKLYDLLPRTLFSSLHVSVSVPKLVASLPSRQPGFHTINLFSRTFLGYSKDVPATRRKSLIGRPMKISMKDKKVLKGGLCTHRHCLEPLHSESHQIEVEQYKILWCRPRIGVEQAGPLTLEWTVLRKMGYSK